MKEKRERTGIEKFHFFMDCITLCGWSLLFRIPFAIIISILNKNTQPRVKVYVTTYVTSDGKTVTVEEEARVR